MVHNPPRSSGERWPDLTITGDEPKGDPYDWYRVGRVRPDPVEPGVDVAERFVFDRS